MYVSIGAYVTDKQLYNYYIASCIAICKRRFLVQGSCVLSVVAFNDQYICSHTAT